MDRIIDAYAFLTDLEEKLKHKTSFVSLLRAKAIVQLNDSGIGYGKIAEMTGLSKGRIQQLVKRGKQA